MFTTSLIALSLYRPSMDLLSLRSHPASISSRIYFSFASCFEVFVSRTAQFLIQASDRPIVGIHILLLHASPSPCASRTLDRLIHLPFQHPRHKHLFAHLTFSTPFGHHDRHDPHDQHPTHSRFARTTRQPLPLLSADPASHVARSRTGLWSSLAQTGHPERAIPARIFGACTTIAR